MTRQVRELPAGPVRRAAVRLRAPRPAALAALAPSGLSLALGLHGLGRQPLWYDEIATVSAAQRSPGALLHLLAHTDAVLGPYYALMHLWMLAGTSAAWVRLPSVLAAAAAVAVTTAIGVRLGGTLVGLAAGALLAVNPFFVFYAQDARPYTLVTLACAGAGYLLLGSTAHAGRTRRWPWAAAATATVYLHLFAAIVVAVQAVAALRSPARRRWLPAIVTVALASSPLALVALLERGEIGWVSRATGWTYLAAWSRLAGGTGLALLDAALVGAAVVLARRRPGVRVLGLWLAAPIVLLVTVSLVHPVYVARYTLVATPALALLAALGLAEATARLRTRGELAVATAFALTAGVSGLSGTAVAAEQARPYIYENMPAAADVVLDGARPGDGIAFLSGSVRMSMDYYLPADDPRAPRPQDVLSAPGEGPVVTGTWGGHDFPITTDLQHLTGLQRVWVVRWVHGHNTLTRDVIRLLHQRFHEDRQVRYGEVEVSLWSRTAATTVR